jgi:propanol-preferring alcohol dehydrogenase
VSFFEAANQSGIHAVSEVFALDQANLALERLRAGALQGAAVLIPPAPASPPFSRLDR